MDTQALWQELQLIKQKLRDLESLASNLEQKIRADSGSVATAPAVQRPAPRPAAGIPVSSPNKSASQSLESTIGIRWLVVTGVIAVVIAVGFGIRIAMERGLFTPEMRCVAAGFLGLTLFGVGYHLRERYKRYGEVLMSGGIAIVFLALYAAHYLYHLLPGPEAVLCILAVAFGSAILAWRAEARTPIYVGMLSCYAAPLLVDTLGQSLPVFFAFLTILNGAYLILSLFIQLPQLLIFCLYLATGLYAAAWYGRFIHSHDLWTAALTYQIIQALSFGGGAVTPALMRKERLKIEMTWALLPVILIAYFFMGDLILTHARPYHLPFAILFAGFFFGVAQIGRVKLADVMEDHEPSIMTLAVTLVIGSHIFFEHTHGLGQTWGIFFWFFAAGIIWYTLQRPAVLTILLAGIFFWVFLKINFDMGYTLENKMHLTAFANSQFFMLLMLGAAFFLPAFDLERSVDFQKTALMVGHGLILRALYLQVGILNFPHYGPLIVSLLWLAYASLILAWGFWQKEDAIRTSALWILGFCTLKVFLYDTLGADRGVKAGSYLALGITLIAAGYFYQRLKIKSA